MIVHQENGTLEAEIKANKATRKRLETTKNQLNKKINDTESEQKSEKLANDTIAGHIKELETMLSATTKRKIEKDAQAKELERETKKLMDEQHIFVGQLVKKGLDDKVAETKKLKLEKDIESFKHSVK